jgi:predicted signal transduction protein with EAL and GGDEF domain
MQADTALYAAKAAGRNTFRIFKSDPAAKGRSAAA